MLKFFDSAHKCPLHLQLVGDGEKKNWGEKNLVIERGCVLMRMSQKTGLYHITAFFWSFAKRLLRRMRRKIVFSIEKNLAYYLFFLLLSFRSKMRMIEVFVFWDAGSEKGKGGIVWNNCGQPMIKQIAVVVPQVVGICVNIFSRMNESCVWKQKTFLFFFLSSSSW